MSNREFTAQRTMLANAMATAGAELLEYMGVSSALAAIPNTEPPQYVVAGTLAMIAKVLPAASVPPLTAPAPLTDELPEYELHQDDIMVAGTSGKDAFNEILRYAAQYVQDGPVELYKVVRTKLSIPVASDAMPKAAPAPQQSELNAWNASEALLYAARVVELYDDATMNGDYMIDSKDCAGILTALASMPMFAAKAAPAAPVQPAEPGPWNVLSEGDKPDPARTIDVILYNGVCLMDREYSKIDWSAVRDWRYSSVAAPVQAEQANSNPPEFDGIKTAARNEVLAEVEREIATCFARGGPPDDPHPDAEIYNQGVQSALECVRALKAEAPAASKEGSNA